MQVVQNYNIAVYDLVIQIMHYKGLVENIKSLIRVMRFAWLRHGSSLSRLHACGRSLWT